jgi:polyisoprenoid-binding protein YceI
MTTERQARWAKSKDFFDAANHPEIVFEAGPVALEHGELTEGTTIEGRLTLRGRTNPVQLVLGPSACALAAAAPCTLKAGTRVARTAFGLPRYRALVGDEVTLALDVVAHPLP